MIFVLDKRTKIGYVSYVGWAKCLTEKIMRHCSKCGKPGHNAATCGRGEGAKTPKYVAEKLLTYRPKGGSKKRSSRRVYICKICKKPGHNARTCSSSRPIALVVKPLAPLDPLAPEMRKLSDVDMGEAHWLARSEKFSCCAFCKSWSVQTKFCRKSLGDGTNDPKATPCEEYERSPAL